MGPFQLVGGDGEDRTPTKGLQSPCAPIITTSPSCLVPPAGVEPTLANYLLHTGYKSAVLPLNYRGIDNQSSGISNAGSVHTICA